MHTHAHTFSVFSGITPASVGTVSAGFWRLDIDIMLNPNLLAAVMTLGTNQIYGKTLYFIIRFC